MALSWNDLKDRALNFSKEWAYTSNDKAHAKPFLVEIFMCLVLAVNVFRPLNIE